MTNQDIYSALADIECALYYRKDGSDNPEGISVEDLEKAHSMVDDLMMFWIDAVGKKVKAERGIA